MICGMDKIEQVSDSNWGRGTLKCSDVRLWGGLGWVLNTVKQPCEDMKKNVPGKGTDCKY